MHRLRLLLTLILLAANSARAEWSVVVHTDVDSARETRVAYTENPDGYSLEVYLDNNGAIRSRFSINKVEQRLSTGMCPTYQIDDRLISNRSINEARCLAERHWAEFVLGYVKDLKVESQALNAVKNGQTVTYRFILETGGYDETRFSLSGSSRALTAALGDLDVTAP